MRIVNDQSYQIEQKLKERSEEEKRKSLAFYRELASDDPDTYEPKVAELLQSLAMEYDDCADEQCEQMFLEALDIRRRLRDKALEQYEPAVAETARNLGMYYGLIERYKKSEQYILEALENFRRCAQRNPETYEPDVAQVLYLLGVQYNINKLYKKSEPLYLEALDIWQRHDSDDSEVKTYFVEQTQEALDNLRADMADVSDEEMKQFEEEYLAMEDAVPYEEELDDWLNDVDSDSEEEKEE